MAEQPKNVKLEGRIYAFRENHERIVGMGYSVLPIHPDAKRPAGYGGSGWYALPGWTRYADNPANAVTRAEWAAWPGAGIGLVLGSAAGEDDEAGPVVVVAVDDDRKGLGKGLDGLGVALRDLLTDAPLKVGKTGGTWFIAMPKVEAVSADYAGPHGAIQLLAGGRQTVVPPSIHPDTRQPYVWTSPLIPAAELPLVTLAQLDKVMLAHGYRRGAGKSESEPAKVQAAAAEMAGGDVRDGLLPTLEVHGGDLTDLWERGAESDIMQQPTNSGKERDRSGNGRRLALAYQMRRHGFNGAEFAAAAWEWPHAEGRNPVTPRDLVRAWAASEPNVSTGDSLKMPLAELLAESFDTKLIKRIGFRGLDEPRRAPAKWIIEGLLPEGKLGLIVGQSRAGKSFIAMGAAAALALGEGPNRLFMGRKVNGPPRGVAYFAAEAGDTVEERMDALTAAGLANVKMPFIVSEMADASLLGDAIAMAALFLKAKYDTSLAVVFVDTFTVMFRPRDENEAGVVSTIIAGVMDLAVKHGVTIILIHHAGKAAGAGARGSSNFTGMVDWQLTVSGGTNEETGVATARTLILAKTRRGHTGPVCEFEIEDVVIGKGEDGRAIEAGYAVPVAAAARGLPRWQREVLEALASGPATRAEIRARIDAASGVAGGVTANTLNRVIKAMVDGGALVAGADGRLSTAPASAKAWDANAASVFSAVEDDESVTVH